MSSRLPTLLLLATVLLLFCLTQSTLGGDVAIQNGEKVGPSFVKTLTDASFEHDTQASTGSTTGDWFVEFYAPWCGHCKSLTPIWAQLSNWVRDEQIPVSIAALDATESVRTAKRFDIRGFPTLKYFSQGRVYDYTGARTLEALKSYVENREWTKSDSKVTPPELSTVDFIKDYIREVVNDLVMLLWRKPGGSSILLVMGFLVGILCSMLVFIVFIEKRPIIHQIQQPLVPATGSAQAGSNSNSTASTSNTVVPPTNPTAKKAE